MSESQNQNVDASVPTVSDMVEDVPYGWEEVSVAEHAAVWLTEGRRLVVSVWIDNCGPNGMWLRTSLSCADEKKMPRLEDIARVKRVIHEDRFCFQIWAPSKATVFSDSVHLVERLDQPVVPESLWTHSLRERNE